MLSYLVINLFSGGVSNISDDESALLTKWRRVEATVHEGPNDLVSIRLKKRLKIQKPTSGKLGSNYEFELLKTK